MSAAQLGQLKTALEATKAKLDASNVSGITKHDLTGDLLQTGILSYFATNDVQDRLASSTAQVVNYRAPSFGGFSTHLTPNLQYGIPLSATMAGVMMDVDRLSHQVRDKGNSQQATAQHLLSQGARQSYNESLIPEQLLSTEGQTVEGVSAAKALTIASQQGQRIYTVTAANAATVLPQLSHSGAVMEDIRNAVNAGKVVTVSQSPVTHAGWTGTGYAVADVQTGAVAYLIGGGADGAILFYYFIGVTLTIASVALVVGG